MEKQMAKETQKAKIERLEEELKARDTKLEEVYKTLVECQAYIVTLQEQQEKIFINSPTYKQMQDKIFILENKLRQAQKGQEIAENKAIARDTEIQKLKSEKSNVKNERGAGRKPKVTDYQKEIIKMHRATGLTIKEIALLESLGVATVHKILTE